VEFHALAHKPRRMTIARRSMKPVRYLRIVLQLTIATLLIACHRQRHYYDSPSIDGFRFGAYATLVGPRADTLRVSATAENISNHPFHDMWGSCYRLNRLAVVAKASSKSWDSKAWEIHQQPAYRDSGGHVLPTVCGGMAYMQNVPPGGLKRYELRVPVRSILADSLAAGRYTIVARIVIAGHEVKNLRAGEVDLNAPTN